jgi:hypothetical protein
VSRRIENFLNFNELTQLHPNCHGGTADLDRSTRKSPSRSTTSILCKDNFLKFGIRVGASTGNDLSGKLTNQELSAVAITDCCRRRTLLGIRPHEFRLSDMWVLSKKCWLLSLHLLLCEERFVWSKQVAVACPVIEPLESLAKTKVFHIFGSTYAE